VQWPGKAGDLPDRRRFLQAAVHSVAGDVVGLQALCRICRSHAGLDASECLDRTQEVRGSNPLSSMPRDPCKRRVSLVRRLLSLARRVQTASTQAAIIRRRVETGEHPSARADVRARIATAQRAHWEARHNDSRAGYTGHPSEFRRLILPRLAEATPAALARATGLSRGYCAQIRDGKRVPHVRHWAAFQLAGLVRSAYLKLV
jgi:hypothetical protein